MTKEMIDDLDYRIVYGCGKRFSSVITRLRDYIDIDYICDQKFDENAKTFYGFNVIHKNEILSLRGRVVLILCVDSILQRETIKESFKAENIETVYVNDVLPNKIEISSETINEQYKDGYEDAYGNTIVFRGNVPQKINICFCGGNNHVILEENLYVMSSLHINCGINSRCLIKKNTTICSATIMTSCADIVIGEDCMLSYNITIRNNDSHHLFDANTGERINYSKDIMIDDHVWIGQSVGILAGTYIGKNCTVGMGSICKASYSDGCVIAGVPGKVIRNDTVWTRDGTDYCDLNTLEESSFYAIPGV